MKRNASGKIADIAIVAAISIAGVLCLVPMLHIFALSLSSNGPIMAGKVTIFPVDIDLTAYMTVFVNSYRQGNLAYHARPSM
ncbi:hypothetical protein ABEV74_00090 [Paenibacillus cisolokensis]|uniref:hypothetical protein n=1 Tax=Paenibacillus cisolokensis TaxID=1658519 RepID=UPI003D2BF0A3